MRIKATFSSEFDVEVQGEVNGSVVAIEQITQLGIVRYDSEKQCHYTQWITLTTAEQLVLTHIFVRNRLAADLLCDALIAARDDQ